MMRESTWGQGITIVEHRFHGLPRAILTIAGGCSSAGRHGGVAQ